MLFIKGHATCRMLVIGQYSMWLPTVLFVVYDKIEYNLLIKDTSKEVITLLSSEFIKFTLEIKHLRLCADVAKV